MQLGRDLLSATFLRAMKASLFLLGIASFFASVSGSQSFVAWQWFLPALVFCFLLLIWQSRDSRQE
jgi:hypothetical protein